MPQLKAAAAEAAAAATAAVSVAVAAAAVAITPAEAGAATAAAAADACAFCSQACTHHILVALLVQRTDKPCVYFLMTESPRRTVGIP